MSILIKGLNTLNVDTRLQILVNQNNEFRCREYINDVDESGALVETGYRDYPVEFLPDKHGRLIDADKFLKWLEEFHSNDIAIMSGVKNARTIIEAE